MDRCPRRAGAILVLLVGLIGSMLVPIDTQASMASPPRGGSPSCAAAVPAPAVCDRTLGLALTVPRRWSVVPHGKLPPGTLAFWTLTPGTLEPPLDLVIAPVGTATTCSDAQAAIAVADALDQTTRTPFPTPRHLDYIAGAPAVFLSGAPGAQPSVQVVVAHHGAVYQLIFPGDPHTLKPDQRQALASLRFIPRSGPFPSRHDPFITPALRRCAAIHTEQLALEDVLTVSPLAFYVDGLGFSPGQAVTVRLTWRGVPLTGVRPRYTSYAAYRILRAAGQGAFVVPLSVPVSGTLFRSFTARVVATDARGARLAAVRAVFVNTAGTIIPSQVSSDCEGVSPVPPVPPVSPVACPGRTPLTLIHSYFTAIARRDARAARACLTAPYRRQMPPDDFGYFGPMRGIVSIRLIGIRSRAVSAAPRPRSLPANARLFLVTYVGRWRHPLVLENGPHTLFLWAVPERTTGQWRIAAEGTGP